MRRFKRHNLAFAVSLACAVLAEQALHAETRDADHTTDSSGAATPQTEPSTGTAANNASAINVSMALPQGSSTATVTNTAGSASNDALDRPLIYGFFDRKQLAELPAALQRRVPASCRGVWITPIPASEASKTKDTKASDTTTRSDYAYYDPDEGSVMSGNVHISQPGRMITADKVTMDPTQTIATAIGNVKMAEPGFIGLGDAGTYNLQTKSGSFHHSQFIDADRQAHGNADAIVRESETLTRIMDSIYSTCEPDSLGWKLKSHQLDLNQVSGRGVARDATLYVGSVPIFYTPYFNFPIDNRRSSGILIPSLRYNSHNGVDFSLPYYLNLAPNYDATLTPRIITNRNPMLNAEFRFLNPYLGNGSLSGGYLPQDPKYLDGNGNALDRKDFHLYDFIRLNSNWNSVINYNYVSDKYFFTDLGQGLGPVSSNNYQGSANSMTQERSATLNYTNPDWGLSGYLRGLTYQELDNTVPDIDRPYGRIQLHLDYNQGSLNGWERFATNDSGYFNREIDDNSGPETNGLRQYNLFGVRYNFRTPGGYAIPTVSARSLLYQNDVNPLAVTTTTVGTNTVTSTGTTTVTTTGTGAAVSTTNPSNSPTAIVPQFTLDSGLTFERNAGSFLQTMEPRLFYAYSPYAKQNTLPTFDTTYASPSFNQLFSPYRFVGYDRLDDNNFATLGVTNRFYDDNGLERYRIGIADRFYFSDRKTLLASTDTVGTSRSSGIGLDFGTHWNKSLSADSNILWTANNRLSTSDTEFHYNASNGSILSLGYIFRSNVTEDNQIGTRQATASFAQPIYNNFRLLGAVQYDLQNRATRDALLGIDYDACCWSISLFGRSYYNDFDDIATTRASRSIVFQITFKGLANNADNSLSTLLRQKIYGYSQVNTSWQNR